MHAKDSHTRSQQAKMQRGYTKCGEHDQINTQQSLNMIKHDQKLHKAKPKHASMVIQMQDASLGKIEECKESVWCMQGVDEPT